MAKRWESTSGAGGPDTLNGAAGVWVQSPHHSELPQKLFFRIGEVAELVGVEPHVLRYWEREFRTIRPGKSAKGQRVYSRRDVENLLRVRDLLYRDGFTIAGAKKKLQRGDQAEESVSTEPPPASSSAPESSSEASWRETLTTLRSEVEAFLVELSSNTRR